MSCAYKVGPEWWVHNTADPRCTGTTKFANGASIIERRCRKPVTAGSDRCWQYPR